MPTDDQQRPAEEAQQQPQAATGADAGGDAAGAPDCSEYVRLLQRERADFANYRRRMEEERGQLTRDATLGVIMRLLPVMDDFERALASAKPEDLSSGWGQGVVLVERKLRALLDAEEVQRLEAVGTEFNPREHEAVTHQPSADVPEGHVLHEVRPGYRKGNRVIRAAQVVVARRPDDGQSAGRGQS